MQKLQVDNCNAHGYAVILCQCFFLKTPKGMRKREMGQHYFASSIYRALLREEGRKTVALKVQKEE